MEKKTHGIDLIAKERQKQIDKYGFTGEHHASHPEWYDADQIAKAAGRLILDEFPGVSEPTPLNWDKNHFLDMMQRSKKERLVIAGALIAAELDRLEQLESKS